MFQTILLIIFILSVFPFLDRIHRIEEDVLTQRPGDPEKDAQESFSRVIPRSGTRERSDPRVANWSYLLTGRWYEEFKSLNHEDPKDTKEEGFSICAICG